MFAINSLADSDINIKSLRSIRREITKNFNCGDPFRPTRASAIKFYMAFTESNQDLASSVQ